MSKARIAILLVLAAAVSACGGLTVEPASPRPNAVLAADKTPDALSLGPAVQNDFVIPATGSVNEISVQGWHSTLQAGFHNAWPSGHSGRKLEIVSTELSFAPAAVGNSYGVSAGPAPAVLAQIHYKARVMTDSGQELGSIAGMVHAPQADSPDQDGVTHEASTAVETMYEQLARKLLATY